MAACPVCGTQDFHVIADADAVKRQLESLWEFHTRRVRHGAPVQNLFDRAVFSQDPPLQIVQCNDCSTVLRAPRENANALVDLYASEQPTQSALQSLFNAQLEFFRPRVQTLTQLLGKTGSVLEVGSYIGGFLAAANQAGWQAHGIDVNEHANRFARSQHCDVSVATLEDLDRDRGYHVVALWNCLDQLPNARAALAYARDLLQPGGLVAIRIPNGQCYAAFQNRPGTTALLAYNNLLTFPYRNGFTLASLGRLLSHAGLEPVLTRGDTLVPIASEWTRRWAVREELAVKLLARTVLPTKLRPWLEVYARRREDGA